MAACDEDQEDRHSELNPWCSHSPARIEFLVTTGGRDGSGDVHWRRGFVACSCVARLLHPGVARDESRSPGGAAVRIIPGRNAIHSRWQDLHYGLQMLTRTAFTLMFALGVGDIQSSSAPSMQSKLSQ